MDVLMHSPLRAATRRSSIRIMGVRTVAVGALTALGLAGCVQGESPPSTLPPLTPAPTASASLIASAASGPVSVPLAAQAATSAGAALFARFWFETLNVAIRSGDVRALDALALPGCVSCERFSTAIDDLYRAGGRIEGGVFSVKSADSPMAGPGAVAAGVTVVYDVSPTRQLGKGVEVLRSVKALTGVVGEMSLERRANSWFVVELTVG